MIWVGTSGYNYPEWKGSFYPETLPAAKMLPYYAERFPTVEINYTFYRAPNEKILEGWSKATPERFKLTLKAPKRITHDARLRDCGDRVRQFLETAATLGPKLGALLFQLPPNLKKDVALLRRLSRRVPAARLRRVRVPPRVVARRGDLRAAARAQPGALRRRQREAVHAGRDHGRLRLLPPARRGLHARRHRAVGATSSGSGRQVRRRLRLLQARRRREGPGVRATDADGSVPRSLSPPRGNRVSELIVPIVPPTGKSLAMRRLRRYPRPSGGTLRSAAGRVNQSSAARAPPGFCSSCSSSSSSTKGACGWKSPPTLRNHSSRPTRVRLESFP